MAINKYKVIRTSDSAEIDSRIRDDDPVSAWTDIDVSSLHGLNSNEWTEEVEDIGQLIADKAADEVEILDTRREMQNVMAELTAATTIAALKPIIRRILRYIRAKER